MDVSTERQPYLLDENLHLVVGPSRRRRTPEREYHPYTLGDSVFAGGDTSRDRYTGTISPPAARDEGWWRMRPPTSPMIRNINANRVSNYHTPPSKSGELLKSRNTSHNGLPATDTY